MSQEKPPGLLQQLFFSDPEFNEKKLQDHKRFTAALLVITSLFLPSLWVWDYITDPVGAMNTIGLRLLYLLIILLAVAFWSDRFHYKQLAVALPLTLLVSEGIFVEILNRLGTGMTHGMGGFMYAMFLSVLAGQGIPLFISLGFTVMATALPHAMALAGLAPEFPHLRYGTLMWPAMGLTMVTQCVLANEYAQRYQLEARLKALSNTDPLCGIANRRHFTQMLVREIQHNRRRTGACQGSRRAPAYPSGGITNPLFPDNRCPSDRQHRTRPADFSGHRQRRRVCSCGPGTLRSQEPRPQPSRLRLTGWQERIRLAPTPIEA